MSTTTTTEDEDGKEADDSGEREQDERRRVVPATYVINQRTCRQPASHTLLSDRSSTKLLNVESG